ncbi:ABC transporter ATP-binding protein [Rickettsiales endosymbiont of Trichoplax sp. H2]|uniref:ABC transporter ATP-binding protein n=1 Tax=Rickettsiales endosymbiont of Trichoplax sp. H2 TaxID=2021221 RepID=UPI0012B1B064|nr:ABC transporter transmembrane domain-containing protein [Rickettsiales endosymbiont of Trichoplax sp. H2]
MQSISSLNFLKPYLKKQKIKLIIMFLALIITSFSVLIFSKYLSYIIDNFFSNSLNPNFLKFFIYQNLLIMILAIGTALRYYFTTSIGENLILDIKKDLFSHLLTLSPSFFETEKTGNIISQIQSDTQIIQNLIGSNLSVALRNFIMLVGGVIMLISMSPKLTLYITILIPTILIPIILFGKKIKKLSKETQKQQGILSSISEESINAIKTIQAYLSEESEKDRYNSSLKANFITAMKLAKSKAGLIFIVIFLVFCGIGLILWYGGYDVVNGNMSVGELSSFIFLAVICAGSIGGLSETFGEIIKSAAACERAADFLSVKSDINDELNATDINQDKIKSIFFKNVYFSYPSKDNIKTIDDLSFEILNNEKIAIVGKSGAGKSTILELLMRFYDINSGDIFINNNILKNLKLASLRGKISYISQDPIIFSSTIYENILFGNPKAMKEQVIEAAKITAVDEFVNQLPKKYNTFIGEKGIRLSGGQKQRVALARAVLKNPEILLLDEATSALDYKNEKIVQDAINRISKGKISITVAHRLSTVVNADRILMLDKGKLIEQGSHQELMAKKSAYYKLVNSQVDLVG